MPLPLHEPLTCPTCGASITGDISHAGRPPQVKPCMHEVTEEFFDDMTEWLKARDWAKRRN